jgi:zinc resistance-associated protein
MKSRLPLALALTGLLGAGVFMAAQSADAQQSPASKEDYRPSAADRAAFLDARIAALHAGLALTPDQEKLWPPVETVLRDIAKARAARFEQMREHMRDHEHKVDPVTRLREMSERQIARGETFKKLADALAPLYAALSDEQKHRLPILMHAIRPHHHHHFGRREGEREHGGWHHRHDGGEERDPR